MLQYVDETKELEAYYALDGDTSDEPHELDQEGKTDLDIRTTSSASRHNLPPNILRSPDFSPNLRRPEYSPIDFEQSTPREIPRSSDFFASAVKRRKLNDLASPQLDKSEDNLFSLPRLNRTHSHEENRVRSLSDQTPAFSSLDLHQKGVLNQTHEDVRSLPDQSPAFSFLNLNSPLGLTRHPSSTHGSLSNFEHGVTEFSPDTRNALALGISPFNFNFDSPSVSVPDPHLRNDTNSSLREAVLMRYFVEVLAPWFDLCDPERHFALVVPHRARTCPPLLNAIFTASARHLTRLQKYSRPPGVQWNDHFLPDLNTETTIRYHNECISNLIQLSMDPDQLHNENLLAAASILRWHEEVDAPFREDETSEGDMFLKVINIFVSAQAPTTPAVPHSLPFTGSMPTNTSDNPQPRVVRADGLRQAAFWVAFRQSIYDSFMKQRPINFPLERCIAFRTFEPAEDAVWADRLIIFCADVLQFCHGPENSSKEEWDELSAQERKWSEVLPESFQPIYYHPPDARKHEVFPEIWYLSDCHVAGVQHVELARILLAVYNPSMPRLGPGYIAAINEMSANLKNIVLRLCAIALGNRRTPPGLVTACMGIAMCGEHFTQRVEQEALVSVLDELESQHAWPTESTKQTLKKSWGWAGTSTVEQTPSCA